MTPPSNDAPQGKGDSASRHISADDIRRDSKLDRALLEHIVSHTRTGDLDAMPEADREALIQVASRLNGQAFRLFISALPFKNGHGAVIDPLRLLQRSLLLAQLRPGSIKCLATALLALRARCQLPEFCFEAVNLRIVCLPLRGMDSDQFGAFPLQPRRRGRGRRFAGALSG